MYYLRLSTGIVLMLAGVAGLIASLIAIYGVREASASASAQSAMILDSAKEGVVFLNRGTSKIQGLVVETKSRTQALEDTLAEIAGKVQNSASGKTPLNALDVRVAVRLQRAQTTVAALQSSLDGFQNTLVLFNSLSGFSKSPDRKAVGEGQELSQSLTEASDILERISRFLNDVLTDREVTQKSLGEVMVWVKQIQSRLADAENRVDAFRQRLSVTEERLTTTQKAIPAWIEQGSIMAIVMLTCFAFTQIGLMLQARLLFRKCAS